MYKSTDYSHYKSTAYIRMPYQEQCTGLSFGNPSWAAPCILPAEMAHQFLANCTPLSHLDIAESRVQPSWNIGHVQRISAWQLSEARQRQLTLVLTQPFCCHEWVASWGSCVQQESKWWTDNMQLTKDWFVAILRNRLVIVHYWDIPKTLKGDVVTPVMASQFTRNFLSGISWWWLCWVC